MPHHRRGFESKRLITGTRMSFQNVGKKFINIRNAENLSECAKTFFTVGVHSLWFCEGFLFMSISRVRFQVLPNKEGLKLQERAPKRSSFQSKTSTISSPPRAKMSSSQPRCFPSTSAQKHCIASRRISSRNASLDCTSELPFYKPKWRSKDNSQVSQLGSYPSSLKSNEACFKGEVVTWV